MNKLFTCVSCGYYPLVFENDGNIKNVQEYEPHPETGEKYCFKCAFKSFLITLL
tara:strand:- start:702 stop:863 length:162 start_codon:yes stop_codon:yes gene_type:complete